MSGELVAFLRGMLDDDEQAALATLDVNARVTVKRGASPPGWSFDSMQVRASDGTLVVKHTWPNEGEHIARWDPARALREIDAKRRTLVRCEEALLTASPMLVHFAEQTLREMALPYAGHPDLPAGVGA